MDFRALGIMSGKAIMLSLFIYEMIDLNKLKNNAEGQKVPQRERLYFHAATYINFSLQCYYLLHYVASAYYHIDTNNFVSSDALFLIGLVMCIAGSCLRIRAKQQLGEVFTYQLEVSEGQRLITNGIYSHLMHPSYLGTCMLFLGISIANQSFLLLITFLIAKYIVVTVRIPREEAMLAKHFGAEFESYSKSRWRMVPLVY